MELVERYLQAVAGYLPADQSRDIIAELKDSLLSQVEEREAALGRSLTDEEQSTLLKQSGHPMLVASRYLPQQHLIGPSVYPYWHFSARLVLLILAIIYSVLAGIALVSHGSTIQSLIQGSIQTLIQTGFAYIGTALMYLGILTVVFALLDRHQVRIGLFDNWQPKTLAPVKSKLKISYTDSLFELVFNSLFICWWVGVLSFPIVPIHDGIHLPFMLSDAWQNWWWGILVLVSMDVLLAALNLLKPWWTRDKLLLQLLLNTVCIAIVYQLFQVEQLLVYNLNAGDEPSPEKLLTTMNQGVLYVLVFVAGISLLEIVQGARRLLLLR